ncbi:YitT family protein [Paenibacillus sp. MBLB4367]|uniref:YitT family protein n=1 Tax=Paenibacillus sp. MBLB4367 TaxID=3384767 RepID=UPI00390815B4
MLRAMDKLLLKQILPIIVGTAIYAFGLHYFVISNELMEGGVTGVALLLNYSLDLPPSYTTLLLNVPLFLIGWKALGKGPMAYSIFGTVSVSFFLWVMEIMIHRGWIQPFTTQQDYFLATLYAGVTLGTGLGIVFRYGGTTGGSDIIARLANKWKGWSMGQVILALDAIIIGVSILYIPREKILYTMVAVFIASKMIDFITEGAYAAKAFTVVSDRSGEIAKLITKEMDRGVTLLQAKGAYSQSSKEVIYCVVARSELRQLQTLIKSVDPRAFIIISDVHDVLGEGFKEG